MNTVAGKGRVCLLIAAILTMLGILIPLFQSVVSLYGIAAIQTYAAVSGFISLIFSVLTGIFLLIAGLQATGKSKTGLLILAIGTALSVILSLQILLLSDVLAFAFYIAPDFLTYSANMVISLFSLIASAVGTIFIVVDRQNSGIVKSIGIAALTFRGISTPLGLLTNAGMLFAFAAQIQNFTVAILNTGIPMLISIFAPLLTGAFYVLLFAIPVRPLAPQTPVYTQPPIWI